MSSCACDFCDAIPPIKACVAKDLILRATQLEAAVRDLLVAESVLEVRKCIAVFRVLMESQ